MAGSVEKGNELMKQAAGKLKSFWIFTSPQYGDAAELYQSAGAQFKACKSWLDAGRAYGRAGECFSKAGEKYNACTSLLEAANCYKRFPVGSDSSAAAAEARRERTACYQAAVDGFVSQGRFFQAAKAVKDQADDLEEHGEGEKAIELFNRAADFFEAENRASEAASCQSRVAALTALSLGQYVQASELFERIAIKVMESPLGKYSARDHLFRAGLCRFAAVTGTARLELLEDAKGALARYSSLDPHFARSPEEKLLNDLIGAFEECEVSMFEDAFAAYDATKTSDSFTLELLKVCKDRLKEVPSIV